MIYTRTAYGKRLRRDLLPDETRNFISQHYEPHHKALSAEVNGELERHGKAFIVDCHSFPSQPLPCGKDQSVPRPEFCIGTDDFHTPRALIEVTLRSLKDMGYTVGINQPYAGTLVPMAYYRKEHRVASIMVEMNRSLYMDKLAGTKTSGFDRTKERVRILLNSVREFQQQAEPNAR